MFLRVGFQAKEEENAELRNETNRQTYAVQDSYSTGQGPLPRGSTRNVQQLIRLRDLFESKSNDFNQTIAAKSQDLQRLCSQITQTITEI